MPFALLPAVDVAGGEAVRPVQGSDAAATTHGPARDAALAWQAQGAEWIHLVDLDAAHGRGSNADLLAAVVGELDVAVELSGGIDDDASLERALASGCTRVVLATTALDDPGWCASAIATHGERIAVGLDVRLVAGSDGSLHHRLAARGSNHRGGDLWEVLTQLGPAGAARYVVTDVARDGMLGGPNVDLCQAVARATGAAVIASGGISSIDDLVLLATAAAEAGVEVGVGVQADTERDPAATSGVLEGAIVGKALYAGRFTLPEALHAVRRVDIERRPTGDSPAP